MTMYIVDVLVTKQKSFMLSIAESEIEDLGERLAIDDAVDRFINDYDAEFEVLDFQIIRDPYGGGEAMAYQDEDGGLK